LSLSCNGVIAENHIAKQQELFPREWLREHVGDIPICPDEANFDCAVLLRPSHQSPPETYR